jgi:hypothetical protein
MKTRPEFPAHFDHLTDDGLRDHILSVSDYLATFTREGPETHRAESNLDRARSVLRERILISKRDR